MARRKKVDIVKFAEENADIAEPIESKPPEKVKVTLEEKPEEWITVVRFTACTYDDAAGRYSDSMGLFELQQEQSSMKIRTVKADG